MKMCRCGNVHVDMKTWVEMSRCGDVWGMEMCRCEHMCEHT